MSIQNEAIKINGALKLFVLEDTLEFGGHVAKAGDYVLAKHEERKFDDGEYKMRPLNRVVGHDVYVVQSLHSGPKASSDDKLNRLLFFIGALKDAGAKRVTAIVPYLCYARKDRQTKWQDPLTLRYVAALFEAVKTDAIVTMEVQNDVALRNAFRCQVITLTAAPLFVNYVMALNEKKLCVVSPDPGGVKRAQIFQKTLAQSCGFEVGRGYVEKRHENGATSGDLLVGDVKNATALILDDFIVSGGTLCQAARAARVHGARRVIALATHGLFVAQAAETLGDVAIDRIVTTDIVPPFRLGIGPVRRKLDILGAAKLFSQAIMHLHQDRPLNNLLAI